MIRGNKELAEFAASVLSLSLPDTVFRIRTLGASEIVIGIAIAIFEAYLHSV